MAPSKTAPDTAPEVVEEQTTAVEEPVEGLLTDAGSSQPEPDVNQPDGSVEQMKLSPTQSIDGNATFASVAPYLGDPSDTSALDADAE